MENSFCKLLTVGKGRSFGRTASGSYASYGDRLIMMDEGRVVVDVSGEEKKKLTISELLGLFEKVSGSEFTDDKVILSK